MHNNTSMHFDYDQGDKPQGDQPFNGEQPKAPKNNDKAIPQSFIDSTKDINTLISVQCHFCLGQGNRVLH